MLKPFGKEQILDTSKLKELAGDNFEFDESDIQFFNPLLHRYSF